MKEKDLKRLSRVDLLEMLVDQSEELELLRERVRVMEALLEQKELTISRAGSIAEAALQLNGVFEAAEAACAQYTENIRRLSEHQDAVCRQRDQESRHAAAQQLLEAQKRCEALEHSTRVRCAEMVAKAEAASKAYWDEVSRKLDAFYAEHAGLKELLSMTIPESAGAPGKE
ncbi:MAG: hypothetical protein IKM31_01330 [Oscillospiraceae bacterium]|nr:hypothetical protein [Oscillospiraceae bacterium]